MVCEWCGEHYNATADAIEFSECGHGDIRPYRNLWGKICIDCIKREIEYNGDPFDDEEEDDDSMPEACAACGSDTYPMCKQGCAIFDDE